MKRKLICLLSALLLFSQQFMSQNIDNEIAELINSKDYLALQDKYSTSKDSIQNKVVELLAEAFLNTALNKLDESNKVVTQLLSNHKEELGISGIIACSVLMADNMRHQGNYKESTDFLRSFQNQLDEFNVLDDNAKAGLAILCKWEALGDGLTPKIIRPDRDCEIPIRFGEDKLKDLIYVDAKLNGKDVSFVFDTGCDAYGTNFVSEGFARKNGIRIFNDSIILHGTAQDYAKMGIADSLIIGDIVYKNVGFTIAPGDNVLPVDTIFMDAVLGSVFMKAVGEIQIFPKEKKIIIPHKESERPANASKLIFIDGQPYTELFSNGERLLIHLDTGGGIGLSSKYFGKHEEEVKATGRLYSEGGVGGYGGMKKMDQYILPSFEMQAGKLKKEIKDIHVLTDRGVSEIGDGSIGNDFLKLFDKVTLNFNKMFVSFD